MAIIALKVLTSAVIWQEKNYRSENGGHLVIVICRWYDCILLELMRIVWKTVRNKKSSENSLVAKFISKLLVFLYTNYKQRI